MNEAFYTGPKTLGFLARSSIGSVAMEKAPSLCDRASIIKCPGLDSNQHNLSVTTPSK